MQTHYALLNVPENADLDAIRLAYRRLLQQWHPDRNPDSQAAQVTQRLNAAYRVLCNDVERRAYDLRLAGERTRFQLAATGPTAVKSRPKVAWALVVAALRRFGNRVRAP